MIDWRENRLPEYASESVTESNSELRVKMWQGENEMGVRGKKKFV